MRREDTSGINYYCCQGVETYGLAGRITAEDCLNLYRLKNRRSFPKRTESTEIELVHHPSLRMVKQPPARNPIYDDKKVEILPVESLPHKDADLKKYRSFSIISNESLSGESHEEPRKASMNLNADSTNVMNCLKSCSGVHTDEICLNQKNSRRPGPATESVNDEDFNNMSDGRRVSIYSSDGNHSQLDSSCGPIYMEELQRRGKRAVCLKAEVPVQRRGKRELSVHKVEITCKSFKKINTHRNSSTVRI